jgi:hypothetical protein
MRLAPDSCSNRKIYGVGNKNLFNGPVKTIAFIRLKNMTKRTVPNVLNKKRLTLYAIAPKTLS